MSDEYRADWADKDFYAELGVKKDATEAEIKKAWRKIAKDNHPDTHPGDVERHNKYKAASEANDVVSDPAKRKKYDEFRSMSRGGFGFGGTGGGQGVNFSDLFGGQTGGLGDMFGDLFGSTQRRQQARPTARKGADAETTTTIGFTDAVNGVTVSLRLASEAPCATCNGTGGKPGTRPHVCPTCEGAGQVINNLGGFSINETCPTCGGRQLVYDEACPTCHGTGRGQSDRVIQARIPAGVNDGQRIRLPRKGGAGSNGGPAGDLYVTVQVSPHRIFGRKGSNLTIDVPVAFDEAALGAEIKIPTLGGAPVTLKVPAGTPAGRTFRVRGKGVPGKDGVRGDLLATVQVQVPAHLDEAARAAVEAYRSATADKPLRAKLFEDA
jgi:molecular chaperone DnaJ